MARKSRSQSLADAQLICTLHNAVHPEAPWVVPDGTRWHLISRCNSRWEAFTSPERREMAQDYLADLVCSSWVKVASFAIMGNHVHLVLILPSATELAERLDQHSVFDLQLAMLRRLNALKLHRVDEGMLRQQARKLVTDLQELPSEELQAWRRDIGKRLAGMDSFMKDFKQGLVIRIKAEETARDPQHKTPTGSPFASSYASYPIGGDEHLLRELAYVDANLQAGKLEDFPGQELGSSLALRVRGAEGVLLAPLADLVPGLEVDLYEALVVEVCLLERGKAGRLQAQAVPAHKRLAAFTGQAQACCARALLMMEAWVKRLRQDRRLGARASRRAWEQVWAARQAS